MSNLTQEQRDELYRYINHIFIGTDRINTRHTAYALKQPFSRKHFYVTTQQFIDAMVEAGFRVQMIDGDNAHFNISEHSLFEEL